MASERAMGDGEASGDALAGAGYDVVRRRLLGEAAELRRRVEALNEARKRELGAQPIELVGNERVRTEHHCVPRDIVRIGSQLVFAYQVFLGLKSETEVHDVLGVYTLGASSEGLPVLHEEPLGSGAEGSPARVFANETLVKDFRDVFKYTKSARVLQLKRTDARLLLAVQIGDSVDDRKVFRFGLDVAGKLAYLDARGEDDAKRPRSHDLTWTTLGRDAHVLGAHPHISVNDRVFVETVGGDLTIKIENNTRSGRGILAEPVDEARQTLDDAEVAYAEVGRLVLLRIKPYREGPRYFIYDEASEQAHRIDALAGACLLLPEDHGVLFPGGYYVEGQGPKTFVDDARGFAYEGKISAPNGEDVLFVFHRDEDGLYCLLPYNLIEKGVKNAIACHGYALLADGTLLVFKELSAEPSKIHPMQIWRTPFATAEHAAEQIGTSSYLGKVGNAELVRGLAEALSIVRAAESERPTRARYEDLAKACARYGDAYFWAQQPEALRLGEAVATLGKSAVAMLEEYEKERALVRRAADALAEAQASQRSMLALFGGAGERALEVHLVALADLRTARGRLVGLRELRGMDLAQVDVLDEELEEAFANESQACVELLLAGTALAPILESIAAVTTKAEAAVGSLELEPLDHELGRVSDGLTLLSEALAGLPIQEASHKTRVLEETSEVFSHLSRARAVLRSRREALGSAEAQAEYAVRFKLFGQTVTTAIAEASSVEAVDERLARMLLGLEELEARFGSFDTYAAELIDKRLEVTEAFAARRQTLLEERQKRAQQLFASAERVLGSVARRAGTFANVEELQGYFAADPMVQKVEELARELLAVGDNVRAEELRGRAKATRQEAVRVLRDKTELGGEGNTIRFGGHSFAVTMQALDVVLVPRDGQEQGDGSRALYTHLTGTDFYQRLDDAALAGYEDLWERSVPSESAQVYRGEFLAYSLLLEHGERALLAEGRALDEASLLSLLRALAASRYDEGYDRGVHDHDAAKILHAWLPLRHAAGPLLVPAEARARAVLYYAELSSSEREQCELRARAATRLLRTLDDDEALRAFESTLASRIAEHDGQEGDARLAARGLIHELAASTVRFHGSRAGHELHDDFWRELEELGEARALRDDLDAEPRAAARYALAQSWVRAFAARHRRETRGVVDAALRIATPNLPHDGLDVSTEVVVRGLLGQHPRVQAGAMSLAVDEMEQRLSRFVRDDVPRFRAFRAARASAVEREKRRLRLDELVPKAMSSFVRNALIDGVYLPLIGANLAKQIGTAGANKRTDQMGLLLLVSPPGYGKTTLMEYVAQRLGLVFMKVNGPALGHEVGSLDPDAAPDATSRREVEKINLAFEMGQNVMLYLDDIQHTSPELLQKFISLCDAQRKIEGSWAGHTKTYDLRGKRFCVVMAGNPYTESGARFQIPDMLANRADTYNLGEVLDGKQDLFLSSYLENALTSNEVLVPLAARDPKDVPRLVAIAQGDESKKSELSHPYSSGELVELSGLLRHLVTVRDVLATVNAAYVRSASQDDAYRTAPPFKLQGSYRNMAKITEKVVAAMNEEELQRLISDHYRGEAQTLTTGAEENLLALGALRGRQTPEEAARWAEIQHEFSRRKRLGKNVDDPAARVVGGLSLVEGELAKLRENMAMVPSLLHAARARPEVDEARAEEQRARDQHTERLLAPLLEHLEQERRLAPERAQVQHVLQRLAEVDHRLAELDAGLTRVASSERASTSTSAAHRGTSAPAATRPPSQTPRALEPELPLFELVLRTDGVSSMWAGVDGEPMAGGLFVTTEAPLPALGQRVRVQTTMPSGARFGFEGRVVYLYEPPQDSEPGAPGFGFALEHVTPAARASLLAYASEFPPLLHEH